MRTEVRAETRLSRVASPARTSWRQNCRGSVSEGTVEELLEGLKTSEWLKICIMSGLSPNFRPDLNGPGQEGNGSILRAPSGFNGGQQVEREVLIWRIGHDALRKSLGSAVIAVVQRGGGLDETLLDGPWRARPALEFPPTQVQIDPGPVE